MVYRMAYVEYRDLDRQRITRLFVEAPGGSPDGFFYSDGARRSEKSQTSPSPIGKPAAIETE